MPNVMAAHPNIGGALCKSSVIPLLVPRRNVWLTPAAGEVHYNCLLSRQHLCQKLLQSNRVCKDYSKSKVGRF